MSRIDDPVEDTRLSRVPEAIEDEGCQAEDVEVDRLWRSPSSKQHVDPDTQVDHRDKSQALIDGSVLRLQNHLNVQPCRAVKIDRIGGWSQNRIRSARPYAVVEHLANQGCQPHGRLIVHTDQNVACPNTRAMPRRF